MVNEVIERLKSVGYEPTEDDMWLIAPILEKAKDSIKIRCNTRDVSSELNAAAVDMAAGEFLFFRKSAGHLQGFDPEPAIKQIQEGDTSVTYAVGDGSSTSEQRLNAIIDYLMNHGATQILSFRRIKW